jgi:predicted phage terminase large subunit-like protein
MHIDPQYDAVITRPGKCTGCGGDKPEDVPGEYCAKCIGHVAQTARQQREATPQTDAGEAARKEMAERELCRRRLLPYVKRLLPKYEAGWFHKDLAARLERFARRVERGESPRLIITTPPRHGKQLHDNTPILTTHGWTTHGELKVGDYVFSPGGTPTRVEAVHPPGVDTMEVEFTNGEVIQCHEKHEWTVYNRNHRKWVTVETRWFLEPTKRGPKAGQPRTLWCGPRGQRGGRAMYQVPHVLALEMPEQRLPLHPYFLGAWLGDGTTAAASMCWAKPDEAVFEAVQACAGHDVTWRTTHATTGVEYAGFGSANKELRRLGLTGGKHIPEQYKIGSIDQRLDLLAGLVDTDGHCDGSRVRIATCSRRLADDICDVTRSMGWRTSVYEQEPQLSTSGIQGRQPMFYVSFYPDREIPVQLDRKRVTRFASKRRIGIKDVRYAVKPGKGRCITVAREDGLYLAGRQLVPTHNSEQASKAFVSWFLGRNPDKQIIAATHSDKLATDNSRDVLEYIQDERHKTVFSELALNKDQKGATGWRTAQGGSYKPVGVGAGISGYGADVLIIDDPHRDKDAYSPTVRDSVKRWYDSSAITRLMPGGGCIIIQTRWVMDDLVGRVLDEEGSMDDGGDWEVVSYPAEAVKDEYRLPDGRIVHEPKQAAQLLRRQGEALHPERWPLKLLERHKKDPIIWQALYQQNPIAGEAAQFKREMFPEVYERDVPGNLVYYATWDTALGLKDQNDYTVRILFGVDRDDNVWLVDVQRGRWDSSDIAEMMIDDFFHHNVEVTGVEKTHQAMSIEPFLEKRIEERRAYGLYVHYLEHGNKDKVARSRPIQARAKQGKVCIPIDAEWYEPFMREVEVFPGGKHDDQADAFAYAGQLLNEVTQPREQRQKPKRSFRDNLKKYRKGGKRSWKVA